MFHTSQCKALQVCFGRARELGDRVFGWILIRDGVKVAYVGVC